MKTIHDVVKHELMKQFPPPKGITPIQSRIYFKKLDVASRAVLRAVRHYVEFNFDGVDGNGHG